MLIVKDFNNAVKNIRTELKNYIQKSKLQSLVIGLSGGIDSALCAALAYPVCEDLKIPFFGRSITIESNKPEERKRAELIGNSFVSDFMEVNLTEAFQNIKGFMVENIQDEDVNSVTYKIRMGNIKARLRMIYLYELASKHKGLVLSTDNLTELYLGFWTLHGDVGDYGMIQQLWKTEVYNMAIFIAENEANNLQAQALLSCVEAVPTDGLGITNSDLDQLQAASYTEVDKILIDYIINNNHTLVKHPVIQRHLKSEYKRNNPLNLNREIYF
ncbi:MAG: NAD(+) synthase [Bacteroidales bacterium]|nr:NAD(+) synthase [Bacteroidales bacterium]